MQAPVKETKEVPLTEEDVPVTKEEGPTEEDVPVTEEGPVNEGPVNEVEQNVVTSTLTLKSSGANGCVYKKNYCNKDDDSGKIISKIDKTLAIHREPTTEEEKKQNESTEYFIGQLIKERIKSPPYYYAFSPLLQECPIRIEELDADNCIEPQSPGTMIYTYSMHNEGSTSLEDKIKEEVKKDAKQAYRFFVDALLYILNSLDLLQNIPEAEEGTELETRVSDNFLKSQQVVHNDLHIANIIYNEDAAIPLIIDFGNSFLIQSTWQDYVTLQSKYWEEPRPFYKIEITLMAYMLRNHLTIENAENIMIEIWTHKESLSTRIDKQTGDAILANYQTWIKQYTTLEALQTACMAVVPTSDYHAAIIAFYDVLYKNPDILNVDDREEIIHLFNKYLLLLPAVMPMAEFKNELNTILLKTWIPITEDTPA